MKNWYEIYLEEIKLEDGLDNYVKNKIKTKGNLIRIITQKAAKTDMILEAGCGTGIISTYLADLGHNVVAVDIDERILGLASDISQEYGKTMQPTFKKESIFDLNYPSKYFKVSFSSGVLEHFKDELIIDAIKKQLYVAEYVVISIPTSYFDSSEALYGNERFMNLTKWRELIEKSGGEILEEDKCHFLKFPYRYFNVRKWFRIWPYRIFLITNKA